MFTDSRKTLIARKERDACMKRLQRLKAKHRVQSKGTRRVVGQLPAGMKELRFFQNRRTVFMRHIDQAPIPVGTIRPVHEAIKERSPFTHALCIGHELSSWSNQVRATFVLLAQDEVRS
jgi:hypothetical protein